MTRTRLRQWRLRRRRRLRPRHSPSTRVITWSSLLESRLSAVGGPGETQVGANVMLAFVGSFFQLHVPARVLVLFSFGEGNVVFGAPCEAKWWVLYPLGGALRGLKLSFGVSTGENIHAAYSSWFAGSGEAITKQTKHCYRTCPLQSVGRALGTFENHARLLRRFVFSLLSLTPALSPSLPLSLPLPTANSEQHDRAQPQGRGVHGVQHGRAALVHDAHGQPAAAGEDRDGGPGLRRQPRRRTKGIGRK